jgi:methionyl-tRNA synthetase
VIPEPGELGEAEVQLRETALAASRSMVEHVEGMRIDLGIAALAGAVREANRYVEGSKPWALAKENTPEARVKLGTCLYCAAETLRIVGGMLHPVMPGKMEALRSVLGCPAGDPNYAKLSEWGFLESGKPVGEMVTLFPRIQVDKKSEKPQPAKQKKQKKADPGKEAPEGIKLIDFKEFTKVELRVAEILEAEKVEGADKLLKLQVNAGSETRQIIAGIASSYAPEDLPGMRAILVANLKPRKVRGVESQGMLLAAYAGDDLHLVTVDGTPAPGTPVG